MIFNVLYIIVAVLLLVISLALLFAVIRQPSTRNVYVLHEGQWLADSITASIAITLAVLLLNNGICENHVDIVFTTIPLIQCVFLLATSIDYLVARFLPHFHRTSPLCYRVSFVFVTFSVVALVITITAIMDYLDDESIESCLPAIALPFSAFNVLYDICLILQIISALFHVLLLLGKQLDRHIKIAICMRIALIFVLFIGPTCAILLLRTIGNTHVDIAAKLVVLCVLLHSLCNTTFCVWRSPQLKRALSSSILKCSRMSDH
ncbi:hypothetical protein Tcan_05893 [Toxocara canis]|uniref:G-protein coupled receptors family 1 profile domain-containing protein n=1 Tax=Toxocara canis TaxID=6265 RepID=A0A0B2V596_TOXCA|nr:hypothetical protein Tcan_05893 [Toxocara canis]